MSQRRRRREPLSNVGFVCAEHAPKPDPALHVHPPEFFVDKFVKLGFPMIHIATGLPTVEHMWVLVEKVVNGKLRGVVNSDPIHIGEYHDGVEIEFEVTEIEKLSDPASLS